MPVSAPSAAYAVDELKRNVAVFVDEQVGAQGGLWLPPCGLTIVPSPAPAMKLPFRRDATG